MNKYQKIILITGASSGIGLACAEHLALRGNIVYGIGRNPGFTTSKFQYHSVDVSNESDINRLVKVILEKENRIDLLINNAGVHAFGSIEHMRHGNVQQLFDSNFFGSLNMIRAILPHMRQRKSGMIICISSIAGVTGLPFQGVYCASKFALEGMIESLRMELNGSGVQATLIEPGDFHTPVTLRRLVDAYTRSDPYYTTVFEKALQKVSSDEANGSAPVCIARKIEKIMYLKKAAIRYTTGKPMQRVVPLLKRIFPSSFFENLIQKNYYQ